MRGAWVLMAILASMACAPEKPVEVKKKEITHAPDVFQAKMATSKGDILLEIHRDWAPRGADRFYELIEQHFFDKVKFHRVIRGFVAQFGVHRDAKIQGLWRQLKIADDPVLKKNVRGTITFAALGPASRTTQLFINLKDNRVLDKDGLAPIGKVIEGMEVADKLAFLYGELLPKGNGPDPKRMELETNEYMDRTFPRLDHIETITIIRR
jgi:peptidyl-prolyl cis-trans isomerase A (cyclophilin A)